MKPDKLEQQFREKLQNRTIEPSDKAWDRLDAMLSVAEKKKKSNGKWWFVAAGFLALISVGSLFFRMDNNIATEENVVLQTPQETPFTLETPPETLSFNHEEIEQTTLPKDTFLSVTFSQKIEENVIYTEEPEDVVSVENQLIAIEDNTEIAEEPQDLITENIRAEHRIKIDYKSLLYQSEMEVETQYSQKALDRFLERNYNNLKLAVTKKKQE